MVTEVRFVPLDAVAPAEVGLERGTGLSEIMALAEECGMRRGPERGREPGGNSRDAGRMFGERLPSGWIWSVAMSEA